jgi:hypothetical protein
MNLGRLVGEMKRLITNSLSHAFIDKWILLALIIGSGWGARR